MKNSNQLKWIEKWVNFLIKTEIPECSDWTYFQEDIKGNLQINIAQYSKIRLYMQRILGVKEKKPSL
jgi:hypothetical protein